MAAVEVRLLDELGELIEDLTTTGRSTLDENQMKKVKRICKTSESYVKHAYHIVITQLQKNHAEIRLSCFQIISELFTRSHAFRELLLSEFQVFLELVMEINSDVALPPPAYAAKILKDKAVEAIESWYQKYGMHYKKLDLGYQYMKRIKHVEFDAIRARSLAERRRSEDRERRRQNIIQKKLGNAEIEIAELTDQMELCITEINNCFKLLLPHPDDYEVHYDFTDDVVPTKNTINNSVSTKTSAQQSASSGQKEHSEATTAEMASTSSCETHMEPVKVNIKCEKEEIVLLDKDNGTCSIDKDEIGDTEDKFHDGDDDDRSKDDGSCDDDEGFIPDDSDDTKGIDQEDFITHHGLGSRSYHINIELSNMKPKIHETEDNTIILDTLREMNKEICHKHLPMVNKWLTVLTKAGQPQKQIQSIIDLKQTLEGARDKFQELEIVPLTKEQKQTLQDDDVSATEEVKEDSEDEFEDVPEKEGVEYIPAYKRAEYGLEPLVGSQESSPSSSKMVQDTSAINTEEKTFLNASGFSVRDAEDPTSHARALLEMRRHHLNSLQSTSKPNDNHSTSQPSTSYSSIENSNSTSYIDEKKNKLLEMAPVVPFDMDLYHWEDPNFEAPTIIRSHNFNNYWASNDAEVEQVFEGDKNSMLRRTMTFAGKFQPVKWFCRAPLINGKLCPRKDRIKCPFHGKIIPRDESGKPVDAEKTSETEIVASCSTALVTNNAQDWKDIQQEIEIATGINLGDKGKKRKGWKRGSDATNKELSRKQKYARLTDLKKATRTPRSRLEKKVLNPVAVKRITQEMDSIARKKFVDKFGDQFNYQLRK